MKKRGDFCPISPSSVFTFAPHRYYYSNPSIHRARAFYGARLTVFGAPAARNSRIYAYVVPRTDAITRRKKNTTSARNQHPGALSTQSTIPSQGADYAGCTSSLSTVLFSSPLLFVLFFSLFLSAYVNHHQCITLLWPVSRDFAYC